MPTRPFRVRADAKRGDVAVVRVHRLLALIIHVIWTLLNGSVLFRVVFLKTV